MIYFSFNQIILFKMFIRSIKIKECELTTFNTYLLHSLTSIKLNLCKIKTIKYKILMFSWYLYPVAFFWNSILMCKCIWKWNTCHFSATVLKLLIVTIALLIVYIAISRTKHFLIIHFKTFFLNIKNTYVTK